MVRGVPLFSEQQNTVIVDIHGCGISHVHGQLEGQVLSLGRPLLQQEFRLGTACASGLHSGAAARLGQGEPAGPALYGQGHGTAAVADPGPQTGPLRQGQTGGSYCAAGGAGGGDEKGPAQETIAGGVKFVNIRASLDVQIECVSFADGYGTDGNRLLLCRSAEPELGCPLDRLFAVFVELPGG